MSVPIAFAEPAAPADAAAANLRPIAIWLLCCCGMIFLMVVIGGITRLTLSGLSITEWQPVTGILPPLSAAAWAAEFEKYRQIPQYRLLNARMSLADFQTIYWWEYAHRLWGRLIGFAYLLPFLYFLARGRIPRRLAWPLAGIFGLGFLQGALGWWMVKSGLADRVEVSQYRLVAHLLMALAIYAVTLWIALGLLNPAGGKNPSPAQSRGASNARAKELRAEGARRERVAEAEPRPGEGVHNLSLGGPLTPTLSPGGGEGVNRCWRRFSEMLIALVALTIAAGGFVAGLNAGLVYNTFPLMDGSLVPAGYARLDPFFRNWFENIPAVQFDHRLLAMTTAGSILLLWLVGQRAVLPRHVRLALHALLLGAALQFGLGVTTLLLVVPIPLAAMHQAGAVLLLTAAIVFRHSLRAAA